MFRDFNSDGVYASIPASGTYAYGEPGIGGVTITAYNAAGIAVATTTSSTVASSLGTYTLTVGNTNAYRVEFTNLVTTDYESFRGISNATSVQFTTGGTSGVNFGANYPTNYCQSNPDLAIPCYENGNGTTNTNPAFVSFPYTSSGSSVGPSEDFNVQTLGSVWGVAYQRTRKRIFTSAFLKRHVGLGPRGMDGVYVMDYSTATPTLLGGFDLEGVTPANGGAAISLGSVTRTNITGTISSGSAGDTQLPAATTNPSVDLDAYGKVGTVGYGDIDVSEDGNTLWMVNLNQKALIAVDIKTLTPTTSNPNTLSGSLVKQYPIASILNVPSCTNGVLRPFGLKLYNGKGYLGLVCDASAQSTVRQPASLIGYVVSFDPASPTTFTTVATIPLNYNREPYYQNFTSGTAISGLWQRWNNTWTAAEINSGFSNFISSPQPLLSDIEFTDNGSMVVNIMDRFSHQIGWNNYEAISANRTLISGGSAGDIIYFGKQGASFVAELGESDPGNPTGNAAAIGFLSTDGVNGTGEFFYGDYYTGFDATHHETALGSATVYPGKNEVTNVALDPLAFNSLGIRWLSTSTGNKTRAYQLIGNTDITNFGKGGGLGDIDILCDIAPIEIGNRVWLDTDNDGIQDANETPLAGVVVTLSGPGLATPVSVTTNANGEYYFSNTSGSAATGFVYSLTGLTAGSSYTLSFPTSVTTGNAYLSSKPNSATGSNADNIDTDPNAVGKVVFSLGAAGQNNFSYDAGYVPCTPPSLTALASSLSVCAGSSVSLTAQVSPASSYTYAWSAPAGVTLTNANTATATSSALTTGIRTFTVTVSTSPTCSTTATVSVTVNALPTVSLSATSATICAGTSTTLTATGGTSYRFTDGTTNSTGLLVVSPTSTTAYSVTVANANGCESTTVATVTVNPLPTLQTSVSCNGLATYDVSFTVTAGASVSASAGTITGSILSGIPSGQPVTITVSLNGCTITQQLSQNCSSNAASLGDFVWLDSDKDGIQDSGEPGIAGVTAVLYVNGVASATTVTDATGFYSFTGLTPGSSTSYVVGFTAPTGYTATLAQQGGNDATDSDADVSTGQTRSVTLAPGENNPNLDAGFYIPSAGLGDFVWLDSDKDGIQDSGEPGIAGVTAVLYVNGVASATTVTDASGFYSFTGLTPSNSTSYLVGFTTPTGYTATTPYSGTDRTIDSNADLITGKTESVTLAPGEFNPTLDAGFYIPSAGLGDFVWLDSDKDGIQDSGEPVIAGVTAILYVNGVASATTVTNASGFYSFTGLTPGSSTSYVVGFTAPTGYTATTPYSGTGRTVDSNADLITGKTESVTLAPGEFNPTLDAGYYALPTLLTLDKVVDKSKAKQGDILTYTLVLTNVGSTTATNVTVRDSTTTGLSYVANSASAPAGTTLTSGYPISTWTVAMLTPGQSLSLTFQAKADSAGILYNVATIPGDTAKVCTSIPVKVCQGSGYQFELSVAPGHTSYKWYRDGVEIVGVTTNVLSVTAAGTYSLVVDGGNGQCSDFSCCPFIIEEDTLPTFKAVAVPATCVGNVSETNGQLVLSEFNAGYTYQYSLGSSFNAAASLSGAAQVIPTNGIIAGNLANPTVSQSYTIRVYNSNGCYTDVTVLLVPTVCGCPASVCVPVVIRQTKGPVRGH
ncbi:SdrD B-like domain-containing protein [Spirosoma gilvum]